MEIRHKLTSEDELDANDKHWLKFLIIKDDDTYYYVKCVDDNEEYIEIDEELLNNPEQLLNYVMFSGEHVRGPTKLLGKNKSLQRLMLKQNAIATIFQFELPDNKELEIFIPEDEFIKLCELFFGPAKDPGTLRPSVDDGYIMVDPNLYGLDFTKIKKV